MNSFTAPCGIDCSICEAYKATQANDAAGQRRVVDEWRIRYNSPEMPYEAAVCDGCSQEGHLGGYTALCPVRACSRERKVKTCAHCGDFSTCPTLAEFLAQASCLREKLEAIRAETGGAC